MSSFRVLSLSLLGGSLLLLLLSAVCEAKDYGLFTPQPDYDSDYNATFEYSFFSNSSMEDLERFREEFMGPGEETEEEEETGGEEETGREEDSPDATVAPATTRRTTVKNSIYVYSAAIPPFYPELRMLVWTPVILMVLKTQLL
ncbi:uncharacterized protein si:ch211-191i18.2 [Cololabis saira]|uniref:uncharacterized protein si:ch211-191i18.2 n=1 Tax=Cololabis saira TaxID=129043 RepID=UPI002AD562C4|nr:uncharacterized protein si:ch211-191i18.2 [Cololabis saira]